MILVPFLVSSVRNRATGAKCGRPSKSDVAGSNPAGGVSGDRLKKPVSSMITDCRGSLGRTHRRPVPPGSDSCRGALVSFWSHPEPAESRAC